MKLVSGLEEALGHGPCFIEDREDDEYHGESRGQAIGETSLNTTSSSSDTSDKCYVCEEWEIDDGIKKEERVG